MASSSWCAQPQIGGYGTKRLRDIVNNHGKVEVGRVLIGVTLDQQRPYLYLPVDFVRYPVTSSNCSLRCWAAHNTMRLSRAGGGRSVRYFPRTSFVAGEHHANQNPVGHGRIYLLHFAVPSDACLRTPRGGGQGQEVRLSALLRDKR